MKDESLIALSNAMLDFKTDVIITNIVIGCFLVLAVYLQARLKKSAELKEINKNFETVLKQQQEITKATGKINMNFDGVLKISEFRQAWINSLRDEMAEFQSYGVLPGSDPSKERAFYKLGTKIELLMNPDDPDYENLQKLMYDFLIAADANTIDKYSLNSEFITLCQKILKREWDRLKADIKKNSNTD